MYASYREVWHRQLRGSPGRLRSVASAESSVHCGSVHPWPSLEDTHGCLYLTPGGEGEGERGREGERGEGEREGSEGEREGGREGGREGEREGGGREREREGGRGGGRGEGEREGGRERGREGGKEGVLRVLEYTEQGIH